MSRVRGELRTLRVIQFLTTNALLIPLARFARDRIGESKGTIHCTKSNAFVGSTSHA
jgi:hypothetical protein